MESEGMRVNDSANDSRWGRGRGGKAKPTHAFLKLLNEPQLLREELESINASPRPELAGLDGKDLLSHWYCLLKDTVPQVWEGENTAIDNQMVSGKKKKKTVFKEVVLKATIHGSQGWQSWAEHGWLASSLHLCTTLTLPIKGPDPLLRPGLGGRRMHMFWEICWWILIYLDLTFTPQKLTPKPIPKPGRVRYDISEDTVGQQGARLFRRK